MEKYDYSQPYVTLEEYLAEKGINLAVEIQDDDNKSNKVNRFIQDITNFVLDHLVMEYKCNELNRLTSDFSELAEWRRKRFHFGMMEQIEYVLDNGLIHLNAGINPETGAITDYSHLVIGSSALKQFKLGSFCNTQENLTKCGSLSPIKMPSIEELLLLVSRKVDKVDGKGLSTHDYDDAARNLLHTLSKELNNKVDNVEGEGLSTHDFSNAYKDKLDGIQNGAQKNVIEQITLENEPLPVSNKSVNIDVSGKENKTNKVTEINDQSTDEEYPSAKAVRDLVSGLLDSAKDYTDSKVKRDNLVAVIEEAKTYMSGLMSAEDKTRLDGLYALLGSDDPDTVVNTINEVLAIFNQYPEGAELVEVLAGKVDKVAGMGLSTNDFTNAEKTKLSDIENNAQVNVLEGIKVNGEELSITDKKVDIEFSSENLISLTYDELVELRDSGELKAGCFYRITDYETTTTQFDTRSAGHVFDIIVRADSMNKLNEQASAIQHTGDTYFSQCKLNAWKIKYCLDNDTTRFAWADAVNGKGVIYWMKDEFNNEAPYDFKNIQFKRYYNDSAKIVELADDYGMFDYEITGQPFYYNSLFEDAQDEEDFIWCYTFNANEELDVFGGSRDISILNEIMYDVEYGEQPVHNNIIKDYYISRIIDDETSHNLLCLNNIVFNAWYEDTTRIMIYGNKFDINCYNMTFIGTKNYENTFGNGCGSNTFGNGCGSNTFGNYCYYNTFGNNCGSNTFGNGCYSNTFGNNCGSNTFGNDCGSNTFGNTCGSNTFGNNCGSNTLLASVNNNEIDNGARWNIFENGVQFIDLLADEPYEESSTYLQNIKIRQGVKGDDPNNRKTITEVRGNEFDTTYRCADSEDKTI